MIGRKGRYFYDWFYRPFVMEGLRWCCCLICMFLLNFVLLDWSVAYLYITLYTTELCSLRHGSWVPDQFGSKRFMWILPWPINVIKVAFLFGLFAFESFASFCSPFFHLLVSLIVILNAIWSTLNSNAGQVRKSLSIKAHADGSGYFVSLSKWFLSLWAE